mgnify:CR=1 FL=1
MTSKLHLKVVWAIELLTTNYKIPFRTDSWCLFLSKKEAIEQLNKEIKAGYQGRLVRYERGKVFSLGKTR